MCCSGAWKSGPEEEIFVMAIVIAANNHVGTSHTTEVLGVTKGKFLAPFCCG